MATDTITLPGVGENVGTDKISGIHYQKGKLVYGADDAYTDVTDSTGLPIRIRNTAAGTIATDTDPGAPTLLRRKDTLSALSEPDDGEYMALLGDENGAAWVSLATTLSAGLGDNLQAMPVPGIGQFFHANARYTSAQTGAAIWTPSAGNIFVVTYLAVEWAGATDGTIVLWCSTTATNDTTFTTGTDRALFDFDCAPSTAGPGGYAAQRFFVAPTALTANPLRITTTAAINPVKVQVDGYQVLPPA